MKETVLDVLLYLFEHFFYEDPDSVRDRDSLQGGLLQAGFSATEINRAFDWLDALTAQRDQPGAAIAASGPVRVYAQPELEKLDADCRGLLMFLERNRVLDATRRELVLDRVMALGNEDIDVDDLKWVVLMVLFNQPGQEAAFAWMENHMFDGEGEPLN